MGGHRRRILSKKVPGMEGNKKMTNDEIMKLTKPELLLAILTLKGWEDVIYYPHFEQAIGVNPNNGIRMITLNYVTNIVSAWGLECDVYSPLDKFNYANELCAIVGGTTFDLIHASAEQRCRAWLMWKNGENCK
jgi:hypothetical protein